jgi:uncharacterized lipoprotein YmbA
MMRTLSRTAVILWLAMLVAACSSTPLGNHYVLTSPGAGTPSGDSPALGIGPIEIPEYLKRNGLVYNREGSRLHISQTERWAEPLDSGIARVVTINLATLLDTQDVRPFPWHPERPPAFGVQIRIVTLNANDQEAELVAEWLVYRAANGLPLQRRISRLERPMPAGDLQVSAIPAAYSELLLALSQAIAAAITAAGDGV